MTKETPDPETMSAPTPVLGWSQYKQSALGKSAVGTAADEMKQQQEELLNPKWPAAKRIPNFDPCTRINTDKVLL